MFLSIVCAALCGACASEVDAAVPTVTASDSLGEEWRHLDSNTARVSTARKWDGRLEGPVTFWHDNGTKMGEGSYTDEEKDGPWTFWHDNGSLRWEGAFADGVPVGEQRAWYANGQLHYEGTWVEGRREGEFSAWHDNGRTAWHATYEHGEAQGELHCWNEDGELDPRVSGIYRDGRRVAELSANAHLAARAK